MLQYVMKADPNSAVSYWPKMSQYVITVNKLNVDEDIVMLDPVSHNSGQEQPPNREQAREIHRD